MDYFKEFPSYWPELAEVVSSANWIVHRFSLESESDLFNPANLTRGVELEGLSYTAFLDTNIFQFATNCLKREVAKDEYRAAAGLVAFCRLAKIEFDPRYAVHERASYGEDSLLEVIDDLQMFHRLDNTCTDELAAYALGYSDTIDSDSGPTVDKEAISEKLRSLPKLREWDSMYVVALGLISIHYDPSLKDRDRLHAYVDWLISKFRLSLPAVAYAARMFGKRRLPKMMKFKPSQNARARQQAAVNLTWDLYLMNEFFRNWTAAAEAEQQVLVTDDRVLKEVLRSAVAAQLTGPDALADDPNSTEWKRVRKLLEATDRPDRVYRSPAWGIDYRSSLVAELEGQLLAVGP